MSAQAAASDPAFNKQESAVSVGSVEESKNSHRLKRGLSKNRIVDMLRRTTTRSMRQDAGQREYRVITAGEDGMIYFWNVACGYNANDLSKVEMQD